MYADLSSAGAALYCILLDWRTEVLRIRTIAHGILPSLKWMESLIQMKKLNQAPKRIPRKKFEVSQTKKNTLRYPRLHTT